MIFLLSLAGAFGATSTAMFISSIFKNSGLYLFFTLVVIVMSIIQLLFNTDIMDSAPWYSYLLPPFGYILLFVYVSFNSWTVGELF